MAEPFIVDVPRHGVIELQGEGPWRVHEYGRGSYEILDSNGKSAKPTMWQGLPGAGGGGRKANQNVVWANKSVPNVIVNYVNSEFAKTNAV